MRKDDITQSKPVLIALSIWMATTAFVHVSQGLTSATMTFIFLMVGVLYVALFLFSIVLISQVVYSSFRNIRFGVADVVIVFFAVYFLMLAVSHSQSQGLTNAIPLLILIQKTIFSLALVALVIFAAFVCGRVALSTLRLESRRSENTIVLSIGLGLFILSWGVFFLGIMGRIYILECVLLLLFMIFIGRKNITQTVDSLMKRRWDLNACLTSRKSAVVVLVISCCAFLLMLGLFVSSGNLLSANWDTFHTYLVFPKTYAENHAIVSFQWHPHWGFPQFGEMIYTIFIVLGGIESVFVFNWFMALVLALVILTITRNFVTDSLSWLSPAILLSIPSICVLYFGYVKVDLLLSLYFLLAVLGLILYLKESKPHYLIITSFFAGVTLSIKYTACLFVLALFVAAVYFKVVSFKKIGILALCAIAFLIPSVPWLSKNISEYGNPVYPLLAGKDEVSEKLGFSCIPSFHKACEDDILFVNDVDPLENRVYTYLKLLYKNYINGGSPYTLDDPGFVYIALLPLILLSLFSIERNRHRGFLKLVSIITVVHICLWAFLMSGQGWYLLPSIILLIVVIVLLIHGREGWFKNLSIFMVITFIFFRFLMSFAYVRNHYDALSGYASGLLTLEEAIARDVRKESVFSSRLGAWGFLNERYDNGDGSIILDFLDTQGYFINDSHSRYIPDFFGYLFSCMSDHGNVNANLERLGVRYIIYNSAMNATCEKSVERSSNFICKAETKFQKFLVDHDPPVVYSNGHIRIYDLKK